MTDIIFRTSLFSPGRFDAMDCSACAASLPSTPLALLLLRRRGA